MELLQLEKPAPTPSAHEFQRLNRNLLYSRWYNGTHSITNWNKKIVLNFFHRIKNSNIYFLIGVLDISHLTSRPLSHSCVYGVVHIKLPCIVWQFHWRRSFITNIQYSIIIKYIDFTRLVRSRRIYILFTVINMVWLKYISASWFSILYNIIQYTFARTSYESEIKRSISCIWYELQILQQAPGLIILGT